MRHVLDKNQNKANEIRQLLNEKNITMFNFISSEGAGKTTVLELICQTFASQFRIGIIEGDAYTDRDVQRLAKFHVPVIQLNTKSTCHLDSNSVSQALANFDLDQLDVLIIENVSNLICATAFDLGEHYRIALVSTAEGNDTPLKYPMLFREAHATILNKTDLIPYTNFSLENYRKNLAGLNGNLPKFEISGTKETGVQPMLDWFREHFQCRK